MTPAARRLLAVGLLAACLAASMVVVGAPAGSAAPAPDPCPRITVAEATENADAVFTGEVTAVSRSAGSPRDQLFANEIRVDLVYKGAIGTETVSVLTRPATRRSPGLGALVEGDTYLVFARAGGDTLVAGGCGGTGPAVADHVTRIEELLGEGKSPKPPEVPQAVLTPVDDSEPTALTRAAAPGLALVLIGLLGLIVVRRLGRRA